ncbi:MAG: hypothetical protein JWM19_6595 [Actinomycetia bacterium]|nr:hypothetical protein [Actinomycetes bacterium]
MGIYTIKRDTGEFLGGAVGIGRQLLHILDYLGSIMSIVITGANGEFGRGVLNAVAALVPGERIVASVRDTARAADLQERGIEVRPGSFGEPDALLAAFRGADAVFVNATFFGAAPELRGRRIANAIRAD